MNRLIELLIEALGIEQPFEIASFIRRLQRVARESGFGRPELSAIRSENPAVPDTLARVGAKVLGGLRAMGLLTPAGNKVRLVGEEVSEAQLSEILLARDERSIFAALQVSAALPASATILRVPTRRFVLKKIAREILETSHLRRLPGSRLLSVFYATDRLNEGSKEQPLFGNSPSPENAELSLGEAVVNIPVEHHLMGNVERPKGGELLDPERHFFVDDVQPLDDDGFFTRLRQALSEPDSSSVLVFVHGFNVSFDAALMQTAQLKHDLKYNGPAIAFTWPSTVLSTLPSYGYAIRYYRAAEQNVKASQGRLQGFLSKLAARLGPSTIHIIAHSMGNRILAHGLEKLSVSDPSVRLENTILAAPDLDASAFVQIASALKTASRCVTLYASRNDRALKLAQLLDPYHRAGDGNPITLHKDVDSVDATAARTDRLAKHGYFVNSSSLLNDISETLQGKDPSKRFFLRETFGAGGVRYWKIIGTKY